MGKDAYYFPHDSNAKDDPKCVLLIEQLGLEGYGIYWILVETLRDQPGYRYPIALVPALARRYNTTTEKVKTVINLYGLFEVDEKDFFSLSLIERMKKLDNKREQAKKAGQISAAKRLLTNGRSTDVQRTFNAGSTSVQPLDLNRIDKNKEKRNTLIDFYFNLFLEKFSVKPSINGAKDGAIFKKLLKTYPDEQIRELLKKFFDSGDKFIKSSGYTIGVFSSVINKLLIENNQMESNVDPGRERAKRILEAEEYEATDI
jgi:hypothetical protein